jgi:hypothetical protein
LNTKRKCETAAVPMPGQEDVLAREIEPRINRTPRDCPSEASLELTDALEGSDPDAEVIVHGAM